MSQSHHNLTNFTPEFIQRLKNAGLYAEFIAEVAKETPAPPRKRHRTIAQQKADEIRSQKRKQKIAEQKKAHIPLGINDTIDIDVAYEIYVVYSEVDGIRKNATTFKGKLSSFLDVSLTGPIGHLNWDEKIYGETPIELYGVHFPTTPLYRKLFALVTRSVRKTYEFLYGIQTTTNAKGQTIKQKYGGTGLWWLKKLTIKSHRTQATLRIKDNMYLYDHTPDNIQNLYPNILTYPTKKHENCVLNALLNRYKHITTGKILAHFKDTTTITIEKIKGFCNNYKIPFKAVDIEDKLIASCDFPTHKHHPHLYIRAYNNHCYVMNVKAKKPKQPKTENIELIENSMTEIGKLLTQVPAIQPLILQMNDQRVISYVHEDTKYICNPDYTECKKILNEFGIFKIPDTVNRNCLMTLLAKKYTKNLCQSFMTCNAPQIPAPAYLNSALDKTTSVKQMKSIDMNSAYARMIKKLPYLLNVDMRQCEIKTNVKELVEWNVYAITAQKCSKCGTSRCLDCQILLPDDSTFYTGRHLKYCKTKGLKFECREELEMTRNDNFYVPMLADIEAKLDKSIYKDLYTRHFGCFIITTERSNYEFVKIANKVESECTTGYKQQITDKYNLIYNITTNPMLYNRSPIHNQLMEFLLEEIHDKMQQIGITINDLVALRTDAITWINREYPQNMDSWKQIDTKRLGKEYHAENIIGDLDYGVMEMNMAIEMEMDEQQYVPNIFTFITKQIRNDNHLYNCFAGAGKTTHIINTLIPTLQKSYLVVTPSHASLKRYTKQKLHAKVIQSYNWIQTVPDVDIIIVDEISMCDKRANDFIYRCFLAGKQIYAYGDFNQLKPVSDEPFNSSNYLKYVYANHHDMLTNYRNKFTIEYYKKIINGLVPMMEYKKYQTTKYSDADQIICYRRETCDKYNKLMLKHFGHKTIFERGVRLICKTNDLRDKGVFNNFVLTVKEVDGENIMLSDEQTYTRKEIVKNFKMGYAITLYGAQGDEFLSYWYAPEDERFLDHRCLYVLISRLKV